jgi:hypothetical protein
MVEEYTSIMKNGFWDIVSRPRGKSDVSSRWLYNIKHVANRNIEKFKVSFCREGCLRERELNMKIHFLQSLGTLPLEKLCPWIRLWDGG